MAENLEDRAVAQLELLRAVAADAGSALAGARSELDRRHPDPSSVAPANWGRDLGATQHVSTARAALSAGRSEQDRIRTQLAAVENPADTATFQQALRAALVGDAAMQVLLRAGEERVAAAERLVAALSGVVGTCVAEVAAAEAELKAAARRQADGDALRAALGDPPLDTVVADAAALRGGTILGDAEDRVAALLPEPLRLRAEARVAEADALASAAAAHRDAALDHEAQVRALEAPITADVEVAERAFVAAEAALHRYVHTAGAALADAEGTLVDVAGLPDLSPAQVQALDPAGRADAVAAAEAEAALAAAVAVLAGAQRVVDEAVAAAVLDDPDADPAADADVAAAVEARDDPAVQGPLATARGDYDAAAIAALDAWEVEVPADLWRGLGELHAARAALDELADQAARDALVTALDDAQDALAAALDARDEQVRRRLAVALVLAGRAAAAAAVDATRADRTSQYLRGDGPGGRTSGQL